MSGIVKRKRTSFIRKMISVAVLTIIMVPLVTHADSLLLLHNNAGSHSVTPESKRPASICLNENGDLVIQHSKVAFTMAYAPLNVIIDPQEQLRTTQRLDCPSFGGISLKISFLF